MRQTNAARPRIGILLAVVAFVLPPGLAKGQTPPAFPSPPPRTEPQTGPVDQPATSQPIGGQSQRSDSPAPAEIQPPSSVGAEPVNPFAGSPLLQMFEHQLSASAPLLQLRLAPLPEEPTLFRVQLALTAEEEYTDNANQTKDNRQSEFRTRLTPGISIRADRPLGNFSLAYAPQVFIPDNSIGNTEMNQNLSIRAGLRPEGKFQFNIADDFLYTNNWQDLQNPGAGRGETNANTNWLQNRIAGEAAYVLSRVRTAVAYTNIINRDDSVGFFDTRVTHIFRPDILYTNPRFNIGGAVTVTRGDENSSVVIPYWSYKGEGRYGYAFTPAITAGMTGYYEYQDFDTGGLFSLGRGMVTANVAVGTGGMFNLGAGADVFDAQGAPVEVRPNFLLDYTHRFLGVAVSARYEQGYVNRFNDIGNSGVTFTRSAGVFLTSSILRDLTATLGIRYEENDYQITTVYGQPAGTKDRTVAADVALRYLLVRSLFLTLGYTGTFRLSTQQANEFNENIFRAGLTYEYGFF
jgi:Putative beta-barrel porin 2